MLCLTGKFHPIELSLESNSSTIFLEEIISLNLDIGRIFLLLSKHCTLLYHLGFQWHSTRIELKTGVFYDNFSISPRHSRKQAKRGIPTLTLHSFSPTYSTQLPTISQRSNISIPPIQSSDHIRTEPANQASLQLSGWDKQGMCFLLPWWAPLVSSLGSAICHPPLLSLPTTTETCAAEHEK